MTHKGSCLCGKITFTVAGDLPGLNACQMHLGRFEAPIDLPQNKC